MKLTRWHGDHPPTQHDVKRLVRQSGLAAQRWEGEPGKIYMPHRHGRAKTLWCGAGSITFYISGQAIQLQPGDKMILPRGTVHSAEAGSEGVVCFESPPLHDNTTVHEPSRG